MRGQKAGISQEFIDAVETMSPTQMREQISKLSVHIQATKNEMENDTKVIAAKEELETRAGPYKDAIKASRNQEKFIIERLAGQ